MQPPPRTDSNRVSGAPAEAALKQLQPKLRGFFVNRGCSQSVAEDLTQETLLKVWTKRDAFEQSRGTLSAWVFTIARNTLIDHARRASRAEPDPTDPAWVPAAPMEAQEKLERADEITRVRTMLAELPDAQRSALKATLLEGRSMTQWADESGTAEGTIKTRVRLGLQKLRKALRHAEQHIADSPPRR